MSPCPRSPDRARGDDPLDPESFWRFAAAAWDRPDVRSLLLGWQERHGVDVIFLLFTCWLPHPLPARRWDDLRDTSRRWHRAVTHRIRALRRRVRKLDWPQGYRDILTLELASERVESAWLTLAAGTPGEPIQCPDLARRCARLFPELPSTERTALLAAIRPLL